MSEHDFEHMTVVYVIAPDENGPCKIGYTCSLPQRIKGIQTGCWLPLAVYGVRICLRRDCTGSAVSLAKSVEGGAKKVERLVHERLKECEVHLRGEWFDVTVAEAIKSVEIAAKGGGCAALGLDDFFGIDLGTEDLHVHEAHSALVGQAVTLNSYVRRSLDEHGEVA